MGARALAAPRWLIGFLAAVIAGCSTFGDSFHVTAFLREQITGDTWRACLAREYQTQTRMVLRDGRDWATASRFSGKGWAVLNNGDVAAWPVSEFDLSARRRTEFENARADLESVLTDKAAAPCACARAQASYDGWIAASGRPAANEDAARTGFSNALAGCRQAEKANAR
jgi:hypothetical protein